MYCTKCSSRASKGSKFCSVCGVELENNDTFQRHVSDQKSRFTFGIDIGENLTKIIAATIVIGLLGLGALFFVGLQENANQQSSAQSAEREIVRQTNARYSIQSQMTTNNVRKYCSNWKSNGVPYLDKSSLKDHDISNDPTGFVVNAYFSKVSRLGWFCQSAVLRFDKDGKFSRCVSVDGFASSGPEEC